MASGDADEPETPRQPTTRNPLTPATVLPPSVTQQRKGKGREGEPTREHENTAMPQVAPPTAVSVEHAETMFFLKSMIQQQQDFNERQQKTSEAILAALTPKRNVLEGMDQPIRRRHKGIMRQPHFVSGDDDDDDDGSNDSVDLVTQSPVRRAGRPTTRVNPEPTAQLPTEVLFGDMEPTSIRRDRPTRRPEQYPHVFSQDMPTEELVAEPSRMGRERVLAQTPSQTAPRAPSTNCSGRPVRKQPDMRLDIFHAPMQGDVPIDNEAEEEIALVADRWPQLVTRVNVSHEERHEPACMD